MTEPWRLVGGRASRQETIRNLVSEQDAVAMWDGGCGPEWKWSGRAWGGKGQMGSEALLGAQWGDSHS